MSRWKALVVEVHRRSLWQVLGIYLVGSWIGYQVVTELADGIGLPDWVPGLAVVLFIVGLPIVLATAFVQEGGPGRGRHAAQPADPGLPRDLTLLPELTPVTYTAARVGLEHAPDADDEGRATSPASDSVRNKQHMLFTWQRAIVGGIVAFLLLGVTAGGYVGMRNAGVGPFGSLVASGRLEEREPVLIAEFASAGTDSVLTLAVGQAFRVAMAQSTSVTLLDQERVRQALQRMGRAGARLDADLARQVALRDGVKGVIVGDIVQAGGRYVLSASSIATEEGSVLATASENAADQGEVLGAVDRRVKGLRERIGDSYRSLRATPSLEAVTTPSLEALRRFSLGSRAYDVERDHDVAINLLTEATELDSTFAMAWRKLGAVYGSAGAGRQKQVYAISKAFAHRDRLTEPERYEATAFYHMHVTNDRPKAIAAYRALLELVPSHPSRNNLGILYVLEGSYEEAITEYRRSIEADSTKFQPYTNILGAYAALGRWDDADRTLEAFARRVGENANVLEARAQLASGRRRYDEAERHARQLLTTHGSNPMHRTWATWLLQDVAAVQGRLTESAEFTRQTLAAADERGVAGEAHFLDLLIAHRTLHVRGDAVGAQRELDGALARRPLESVPLLDRRYPAIAIMHAKLGKPDRARAVLEQYLRDVPDEIAGDRRMHLAAMRASIAQAEQRHEEAIREFRNAIQFETCRLCRLPDLARAFDAAGMPDSAAAYYQRYTETPEQDRIYWDGYYLAPAYERLAELYAAAGKTEQAAAAAAEFVGLWRNADPELQPRVRAKQEMLARMRETR